MPDDLLAKAQEYLAHLCAAIPERCVGSAGNRAATDFFAEHMRSFGFATATQEFCLS
ncbi:MAG: hypothetical protein ACM3ZC_05765 [Bacteroidota bacterium]